MADPFARRPAVAADRRVLVDRGEDVRRPVAEGALLEPVTDAGLGLVRELADRHGAVPAREDHLHRPRLAGRPREALRPACARHDPELDLGLAELGVLAGDDHVAGHRQLAATTEGVPANRRDEGLPDPLDPLPAMELVV